MATSTAPVVDFASINTTRIRRQKRRTVIIVIVMFAISALFLLPFAWMLTASVRTEGSLLADPATLWPTVFTLENYAEIWRRIPFGRQLLNTIVFSGVVTVVSVTLNSMAGYALARFDFRGKNVTFLVLILTLMVPIEVTFVPLYNIISNFGWIDTYQGLIVPRLASAFGIFLMRQFFISLPKDLEDAARIDGASEIRHLPEDHVAPGEACRPHAGHVQPAPELERPALATDGDHRSADAHPPARAGHVQGREPHRVRAAHGRIGHRTDPHDRGLPVRPAQLHRRRRDHRNEVGRARPCSAHLNQGIN